MDAVCARWDNRRAEQESAETDIQICPAKKNRHALDPPGSPPRRIGKLKVTNLVRAIGLPLLVVAALIAVWSAVWISGIFHASAFPAPMDVVRGFAEEIRSGRLFT